MNLPFSLRMARRESRSTRRRLVLYIAAITLGVAALVAINSFRANVTRAVREQARDLLGADLQLRSRWKYPAEVEAAIDSIVAAGVDVSRVTTFSSMALATRSGLTRLLQVRAVSGGYPYYGEIETEPVRLWQAFRASRSVLVDPAVLIQLDALVGDTLAIGEARFIIAGTVTSVPGDIGLRSAVGPRAYIPAEYLEETGLLRFGSVARYLAYLRFDDPAEVDRFLQAQDSLFEANRIGDTTVEEYEEDLTQGLDQLASFLGLVGLVALLLGGVGVASGVHVFVTEKLDTAAVLRCLGARQRQVFAIYLWQAAAMGLTGASLGVLLGIGVQAGLPLIVQDFLPLEVPFRVDLPSVAAGLGIGLGVAVLFALLPLLRIRDVAPLRALRRDFETVRKRFDAARVVTYAALAVSLVTLTLWQAPDKRTGLAFAAAIAVTMAVLAISAVVLMRATRRFFPKRARFTVRQGVANLFRPHNQTLAVTLAIGFGVFLIATLYVVHRNLLDQIVFETRPDRPNLLLFDIQTDQEAGVQEILERGGAPILQRTAIVPARIARLRGLTVDEVLEDTTGARPRRWALLREYRHTYRDTLVGSERLTAGRWWPDLESGPGPDDANGKLARVSIEVSIAEELNVSVGDRITWDIQGVPLESVITSVRRVDWARFEPNFYVVFEPGNLEDAPQSVLILTGVEDATMRAEVQRDLVLAYPNVSALDLTLLLEAIDSVLSRVALAIRFMALFSIGSGLVILIGAIGTSRFQRIRESILLKTIGATSRTIRHILATEYFALGTLAGFAGVVLASIAGWALIRFLFELTFYLPGVRLMGFWLATALLTTAIGLANSRDVVKRTPLAGMRDLGE